MERKQWIPTILAMMLCALIIGMNPMQTQAADQNAYRAVFDAEYYYQAYPDVAAAYGMDTNALFQHFVNFGVREGRSASAAFNPQAYRQRYADLQAAFGSDMAAYCRHYVTYGRAEGRNAASDGQTVVQSTKSDKTQDTATIEKKEVSSSEAAPAPVQQAGAIGTCTTSYESNVPRATNVQLAAQRINGVVVQPGASFSFSNTILARTSENGYVTAPIFISGKKGMGTGGGVCQVSSTLYAAMVYAGLPATERHAHSLPVDYLPAGLDATIAGNYLDLKFTNTFSQPLLIQASADGGTLTVSLVLR